MELKKFISVLKGFRTRFTNKPNAELERKSVETLSEKFGGKLEVIASLNESGEDDLKEYFKKVLCISAVPSNPEPVEDAPKVEEAKVEEKPKLTGKVISKDEDGTEYATVNGKVYQLDSVKKTMKMVYKDFKDLATADLNLLSDKVLSMTTYQRYLRDKFPGEDMPVKKGKLHFRGYRISCDAENGFIVEDTTRYYALVETPFEGIPTPKELGDWLEKPGDKKIADESYYAAVEKGKELARKAKEERESKEKEVEEEEPDFEALRSKVLMLIADARSKTIDVDPEKFITMIPFKRWKRKVKSLYTQWKDRKIRYAKFLKEIETLTKEETFVVEEKRHRSKFTGTLMPEHKSVGMLVDDKIEVDGAWIDAVPFLLEYLLFHEKRAMSQIMKYAAGEITDVELIKNPLEVDWKVEYNRRALKNTAHNARVLCMVYDAVGIVAPQDLLYESDLQVGDRIMISVNGELKTQTVASVDYGITLGKEIGLLKLDKWIKISKKSSK